MLRSPDMLAILSPMSDRVITAPLSFRRMPCEPAPGAIRDPGADSLCEVGDGEVTAPTTNEV